MIGDEDHGARAVQILEPIHRESGDGAELIVVLDAKARQATDAFDEAETWREVARLYETRACKPDEAFDAWGYALAAEPADDVTRAEVDRLAAELGAWERYLEICERAAKATDEATLRGSFLRSVAQTQDRELGDPRAAS